MLRRRRPYGKRELWTEKALSVLYAGGWPGRLWGLMPAASRVRLVQHDVVVGRDPGRPPLRVGFISDIHVGPTTSSRTLDRAFALLHDAAPEALLLGGDYVYLGATPERVRELNDRVTRVHAGTKIAVLGNHDFWARPARLEAALSAAGTIVLVNEAMRLPPPHDDVAVIGLDDPYTSRNEPDHPARERAVQTALAHAAEATVRVALCHAPDGISWVRGRGVHLFLCGHTHGGHIALPGFRPLLVPSPMGKLYPHGLHQVDGLQLFVSRGVGGALVPFRTYAPPDVAVFTIR